MRQVQVWTWPGPDPVQWGPGPGPTNGWTEPAGPGPGPKKMPQTWPGPDLGQSNHDMYNRNKKKSSKRQYMSFGPCHPTIRCPKVCRWCIVVVELKKKEPNKHISIIEMKKKKKLAIGPNYMYCCLGHVIQCSSSHHSWMVCRSCRN